MELPNKRILNLAGFAACAGLMVYALYAQYVLELAPCPLCVFQRVAVIALGIVFLLAGLHKPGRAGGIVYALLVLITAGAGIGVAGRHVWLQGLPSDQVPACGPGLDFMLDAFPLGEVLRMVLSGSGECADVDWSFLGLSMPAWVLIALSLLGIYGIVANLRRD
jgi:disulfide bond formation protein DsbB